MRLALIGSTGHSNFVLNSQALGRDVDLVAAARSGPDDALPYVGQSPAAPAELPVYDDYRRMLDDVRPDLVGVFMPLYRNAEASIAAAEHGCHVISEKPLATTLADLDALRTAVAAAGTHVAALMTTRGEGLFRAARDAVQAGRIGEPVLAFGQKSYPFAHRGELYERRETYGGSIPWAAIHALDFVSWTAGQGYTRVAAMHANTAHPSHPGMEDNGGLLLALAGGGHAVISFDYLRPWGKAERPWADDRLRIAGTEAAVEVLKATGRAVLTTPDGEEELTAGPDRDIFADFVAAVRGDGPNFITTAESLRITEVALKARDAADTGKVVDL